MITHVMSEHGKSYTKMTAEIYDAIYAFKDYEAEAERILELVNRYKDTEGNDILDVACGTGAHLPALSRTHSVVGLDNSEAQLSAAHVRLPGVEFINADMRSFDLGRQFDVVTCLFSSIGYMETVNDLQSSIAIMSTHLKNGGVLLVEPWLKMDQFDPDYKSPPDLGELPDGTKIKRTATASLEGNISVMLMHHELDGPNGHEEFDELHRLAMHSESDFRFAFTEAGLDFAFDPEGIEADRDKSRGLYIGVKATLKDKAS